MPFNTPALEMAGGVRGKFLIDGTSGSGKTLSALRLAFGLAGPNGRVGAICSENGRILRYARRFPKLLPDIMDVAAGFHPERYVEKIAEAAAAKLDVLVVDSASHEWQGRGGIQEIVDTIGRRQGGTSSAWATATPLHRKFIDAIITAPMHVIVTCRTDTDWVYEQVSRNGRNTTVPRKVGTKIAQRPGFEYEFDVWLRIDTDHRAWVEKTNFDEVFPSRADIALLTEEYGAKMRAWLEGVGEGEIDTLEARREEDAERAEEVAEAGQTAAQRRAMDDVREAVWAAPLENTPERPTAGSQASPAPKGGSEGDPTGNRPPDGSQIDPDDVKTLPDGTQSTARLCSAILTKDGAKTQCPVRMYPKTTETYQGQEFKASSLIAISLKDFGRVLCPEHYTKAKEYKTRKAAGTR